MKSPLNLAPPSSRLAYRVDEVAAMLGVCRRTVERAITDKKLIATKLLGATLITAASVSALLGEDCAN
jgi:excisionase family DNA binding protein